MDELWWAYHFFLFQSATAAASLISFFDATLLEDEPLGALIEIRCFRRRRRRWMKGEPFGFGFVPPPPPLGHAWLPSDHCLLYCLSQIQSAEW